MMIKKEKDQPITSGFTQAGVYARRNICANLQGSTPPEVQCKPPLRQAARTLYATCKTEPQKKSNYQHNKKENLTIYNGIKNKFYDRERK